MVPGSFSALAEYSEDAIEEPEIKGLRRSKSDSHVEHDDPNIVILKTFEDVSRRPSSTGRTSRVSPISEIADPLCALSLSPALASSPSPAIVEDDNLPFLDALLDQHSQHATLFAHFRHVVWKQLFPRDHAFGESYGPEGLNSTLSVDFLEREAAHFPPVRVIDQNHLRVNSDDASSFLTQSKPSRLSASPSVERVRILTRCNTINRPFRRFKLACGIMMTWFPTGCFSLTFYSLSMR